MNDIWNSPNNEAVILVDATNAFNSLNRQTALRNISKLCPSLAVILINTYRSDTLMYIGGRTINTQVLGYHTGRPARYGYVRCRDSPPHSSASRDSSSTSIYGMQMMPLPLQSPSNKETGGII
jgi:hypothetical protein